MTSYIVARDILEHALRFRAVSQELLRHLRPAERGLLGEVLRRGLEEGFVVERGGEYVVLSPLRLLLAADSVGVDTSGLADFVEWREFEEYIAKKFEELGWECVAGYEHRGPERFQVDLIAFNVARKVALFVECKHWRTPLTPRRVREVVKAHVARVEKYNRCCEWVVVEVPELRKIELITPVVVMLRNPPAKVIEGVPVVALRLLEDFVINLDFYSYALDLLRVHNRCSTGRRQ